MKPKSVEDMQQEQEFKRQMSDKYDREANLLERCIVCQKSKRYAECAPDCAYRAAQG